MVSRRTLVHGLYVLVVLNANVYCGWKWLGYTARTTTSDGVQVTSARDSRIVAPPVVMYGHHSKNYYTARPNHEERINRRKIERKSNYDMTIYDQFFPGLSFKTRNPVVAQPAVTRSRPTMKAVTRSRPTKEPITRSTVSVFSTQSTKEPGSSRQSKEVPVLVTDVKSTESPALSVGPPSIIPPDGKRRHGIAGINVKNEPPITDMKAVPIEDFRRNNPTTEESADNKNVGGQKQMEDYEAIWEPSEPIGIIEEFETRSQIENDRNREVNPIGVDISDDDESKTKDLASKIRTGVDSEPENMNQKTSIPAGVGLIYLTDYSGSGLDNSRRMFRKLDTEPTPRYCNTEKKLHFVDKCEPYKETTCHSVNRETCHTRELRNCSSATIVPRVEEICLNSPDKVCSLVEDMKEVEEEEVILEESCEEKEEEVCDYRYKVERTEVEEELCVELDNSEVNCKQNNTSCYVENGNTCDSTLSNRHEQQEDESVGCEPPTPLCRNVTSQHARLVINKICRDKPITVCRINEVVRPVIRKKFTYTESCSMVPNIKCSKVERRKLEAKCVSQGRPACQHHLQEETCTEEEKEYCYQVAEVEEVEVCDDLLQTEEV